MTREQLVALAESLGWKPWGKLRRHRGSLSSYQCFRRKSEYAWIGLRYVERSGEPTAVDFVLDDPKEFLR